MARERYLLHGGEESIHDDSKVIKPETKKDKLSNFWFYYNKLIIIGVILLLLLGWFIFDMVSQVKSDYTISVIVGDGYLSDSETETLTEALKPYAKDLNNDGQVVITVTVYNLMMGNPADYGGEYDPQIQTANIYKLSADVGSNSTAIYITDTTGYYYCQSMDEEDNMLGYLDGTEAEKGAENVADIRLPLRELEPLQQIAEKSEYKDFTLSLRYFTPGQLKNSGTASMYAESVDLLNRLKDNQPLESSK